MAGQGGDNFAPDIRRKKVFGGDYEVNSSEYRRREKNSDRLDSASRFSEKLSNKSKKVVAVVTQNYPWSRSAAVSPKNEILS